MAEDYKSAPVWEPQASSHGAQAALLAAKSATSHDAWKPSSTADGMSAANLAFKSSRANTRRDTTSETIERHKSLVAAQGAVARRRRADSAPAPRESYPDEANAAANALSAATAMSATTRAHGPPRESYPDKANAAANALSAATRAHLPTQVSSVPLQGRGAIPYTTMNKLMFTSRPPVKIEVDEKKRADVLHASAVAMAKQMYNQQQKMIDARKSYTDKISSRGDLETSSSISDDAQHAGLTTLQDAAYKQAQARLAKMQQENARDRDLQDYYGTKPISRRFSVTGKLRKRSWSEGSVVEDQKKSEEIRNQMSLFSNKLSEVDKKKQHQDQEALLAAAQRNVHQRLKSMDEKIASETGMVPPSTREQWDMKARSVAHSRAAQRVDLHEGKVDIGSGKYMDQEEINAIAARRIQPILDEINEKAELEQARRLEMRLEMERKNEEHEREKARQKEIHDIQKKIKGEIIRNPMHPRQLSNTNLTMMAEQEKLERKERKAAEKQEAKSRKEGERATKAEERGRAHADISLSTEQDHGAREEAYSREEQPVNISHLSIEENQMKADLEKSEESPRSPRDSSHGRVKTWIKTRFSRGPKSPEEDHANGKPSESGFTGGASLTGIRGNESSTSIDHQNTSVRVARRDSSSHPSRLDGDTEAVSPLSSESGNDNFRDEVPILQLTAPRPIRDTTAKSCSPNRESRFHEILD